MNLYTRKQGWKIALVIAALMIVGLSLSYTNHVVQQIRQDETQKAKQWANNLRNNLGQINLTEQSFKQQQLAFELLKNKEQETVELWAKATEEIGKEQLDYTFFVEILQKNENIPVLILDDKGNPSTHRNLQLKKEQLQELIPTGLPEEEQKARLDEIFSDSLRGLANQWGKKNEPIEIRFLGNKRQTVYYDQSQRLTEYENSIEQLQQKTDSLFDQFNLHLKKSNQLFPMIFVTPEKDSIIQANNAAQKLKKNKSLEQRLKDLGAENDPIPIKIGGITKGYIYYQNSEIVGQLKYYPYVMLLIISLFLLVGYFLFSSFRRAEQNQVWVGMAKETAHQLGTPLSSLMAWNEILKADGKYPEATEEIDKDLDRLQIVTDRFSKIGSGGKLVETQVYEQTEHLLNYLKKRVGKQIEINIQGDQNSKALANVPLLNWAIENIVKNGIDAMEGIGTISVSIQSAKGETIIDISDTGKGIPTNKWKTVFNPGYTSKKRGWGLGLSLVRRIIEDYHKGKVFVKESSDKGTTFRIALKGI